MTELEKVEKLREKSDVTYAEAKEALEKSKGDILDALIYLENQGKTEAPAGGGFYSDAGRTADDTAADKKRKTKKSTDKANSAKAGTSNKTNTSSKSSTKKNSANGKSTSGSEDFSGANDARVAMGKFGAFCGKVVNKGFSNHLVATKGGEHLFAIPVFIVAILVLFFFWVTIPLFIITLFCGFAYRFRGHEFDKEAVNSVMDSASNVAEDIKKSFAESSNKEK